MENNEMEKDQQVPNQEGDVNAALEDVLKHAGDMGLYQKLLFIGMLPFGLSWAFVYFGQMFLTATPQEYWCLVPELDSLSADLRLQLSTPKISDTEYDRCKMFDANWTVVLKELLPPDPSTPTIPCQNSWEFLFDDIPYSTVVSEREWICDRSNLVPWSQTISFIGSMCGNVICGALADMYGRVPILIVANLLGCVGSIASIFTQTFWDFAAARFVVGMANNQCFMLMYILEYVGVKYRTLVANMSIALFFGGGSVILPWLAYWIADWRLLTIVSAVPMFLVVVAPFTIPESARWLTTKGRVDEAIKILRRFERINGTTIPQEAIDKFIMASKNHKMEEKGLTTLFKSPALRNITLLLVISIMCVALAFDSLIRMSENIGLNFFVTFTVTSATEIPSITLLVFLLDRYGRRMLYIAPMLLICGLSIVAAFLEGGVSTLVLVTCARFCSNMSYNVMIQWTPELMPTMVRASGTAFVHTLASVAIIVSPFVVYTYQIWSGLPLVIVAGAALVGGITARFVPETTGQKMPQTIEDVKALQNRNKTIRIKKNEDSTTTDEEQIEK